MYKNILVFIDCSKKGSFENVMPAANDLASNNSAVLNVMTVVPDFGSSMVAQFFADDFDEKAAIKKVMQDLKSFIDKNVDNSIKTRPIVATGKARNAILKCAKDVAADLIMLSPSREAEKFDWGVGATTSDVVRHSEISVLVVR